MGLNPSKIKKLMLTLFTIPKPFKGHIAIIQRNAIQSWLQLRPACEIILLGDDPGTAQIANEFGLHHIPDVARSPQGTPLLDSLFERAQQAASCQLLAYVNADIILLSDFVTAVRRLSFQRFVMVGRRWNLNLTQSWDFNQPDWETRLRKVLSERGVLFDPSGIDYFVFSKGLWGQIPPFAIGRTAWDNWLIYRARACGGAVVEATQAITAIHQNHDYTHVSGGFDEVWYGAEAQRNRELAGGWSYIFTLEDATHILTTERVKFVFNGPRLWRHLNRLPVFYPWLRWPFLPLRLLTKIVNLSRSIRTKLGLASNLGDFCKGQEDIEQVKQQRIGKING
jgi:hypothetical protein